MPHLPLPQSLFSLFLPAEKSLCLPIHHRQCSPCSINNCVLPWPLVPWRHTGNSGYLWGCNLLPGLHSHVFSLPCDRVTQGMGRWTDSSESATWKPSHMKWQGCNSGWLRGCGVEEESPSLETHYCSATAGLCTCRRRWQHCSIFLWAML